jgi:hypothetical protein
MNLTPRISIVLRLIAASTILSSRGLLYLLYLPILDFFTDFTCKSHVAVHGDRLPAHTSLPGYRS